jgi:CheY-like chemotaxis protein
MAQRRTGGGRKGQEGAGRARDGAKRPRATAPARAARAADPAPTTPSKKPLPFVLIVEDFADAREMYAEYLTYLGYRVITAENGAEAIDKAVAERPDVILMDLSLPVLDGWEATRRLKQHERTKAIPVIALTGNALAGHDEHARKAGCDAFLTKPCLPQDVDREIRRILGVAPPA